MKPYLRKLLRIYRIYRVYDSRYKALNPTPGATTGGMPKGALSHHRTCSPAPIFKTDGRKRTRGGVFFMVSFKGRSLLPEEVRLRTEVLILKF
ncbi:hypothetical protein [Chlorogloeopsis sp. ULAP02]|uniref:hypothetical protein n=1 Tax=Chlorogloeopsis sp. ULAP02 TaxID=3107926 RepID=UPI0031372C44